MGIKDEKAAFSSRLNAVLDWKGFAEKNQGRQTKLAAMFKTSQKGARKWLEGEAIPRLENIRSIAQEFGVHIEWLHYGNGPISSYHYEVGQRIHKAREAKGWTEGDLASALRETAGNSNAIKAAGIKAIESGRRMEISPTLEVYADVFGVSLDWLEKGENGSDDYQLSNMALESNSNHVVIPHLSATGSMGKGIPADLEHDTVVSQVSVNKIWIRENLSTISSPNNLSMITGYGDSMEGTFNHGDVLFVDTGIDEIKMDAVYVLNLNDELYIKRLQRKPDGSILMISDNAKYQPYTIQNGEKDKFQVLGRIVGIWNFKRM